MGSVVKEELRQLKERTICEFKPSEKMDCSKSALFTCIICMGLG